MSKKETPVKDINGIYVLATILLSSETINYISPFIVDRFSDQRHVIIFNAIKAMDGEIDLIKLCEYLKQTNELELAGGATFIAELSDLFK